MAGRAALVAMDEARREAATRTAAIVMVVDGLRGEVWMELALRLMDGKSGKLCDLGKRAWKVGREGRARKNEGTGGHERQPVLGVVRVLAAGQKDNQRLDQPGDG